MSKSKTGKRKIFRINNMRGLVNTEVEDNAFNTLDPNAAYGVGFTTVDFEFKRIENWRPTNRGGLSKTYGYSEIKDVGSDVPIRGLYRYIQVNGTSEFILAYGGDVYSMDESTFVLTDLSMTVDDQALDFQTAYDLMIVCDGDGAPQTYDGSNVDPLIQAGAPDTSTNDTAAVDGARQSVFHQNRLFLFSATHDQSLLYYSDPGIVSQGYFANFINCNVNDGQKITAISRFFIPGELRPVILVSKERSFGFVTGSGTDTDPYTYISVADDIGCPGFRQIVQFEQNAAFFTSRGICSYQAAQTNQNIERRMLSQKIANQFTTLSNTYLGNAIGWYDAKNNRVSFAMPTGSSEYANKIWHYDTDLGGFYSQTGFDVAATLVDTDGTVYTGTSDGLVFQHTSNDNSYDGAGINAVIETPFLDFFEPHYYKRIVNGRVIARGNGNYSFGISSKINNGTGAGSSHTIQMDTGAYTWGGGNWNNDGSYQWGASPLVRKKFFPGGIFENIAFTITNANADEPIDFLEMILEVEYLNLI